MFKNIFSIPFALLSIFLPLFLYSGESSSNPGAVNYETGTGALGKFLGIKKESGVRIGGLWIGDLNYLICGGVKPHTLTADSLFQLSLSYKTNCGGLFGVEFLQFDGRPTNVDAGSVQGYNSLPGPPPLDRSELYQLWYRQELFDKKLIIRLGKSVPSIDFNNVVRPVPVTDKSLSIPATTALIYTPIFVNSTMLGVLPGYYNSAYGITATVLPTENIYGSYGLYDGNLGRGRQTGLRGPQINQYRFQIGEIGASWMIGEEKKPGNIGIGSWNQSGRLFASPNGPSEHGASGVYVFGAQRLWFKNPGVDNSGLNAFFQWGANDSKTLPCVRYYGAGLTCFGLVPCRLNDSFGFGAAIARLNPHVFERRVENMFQGYYQMFIIDGVYLESAISYIPTPGAQPGLPQAWAATARIIALF